MIQLTPTYANQNFSHIHHSAKTIINLNLNSPHWSYFDRKLPSLKKSLNQFLGEFTEDFEDDFNFNIEKDILPIIGEKASLALFDTPTNSEAMPDFVFIIDIKDPSKLNQIFAQMKDSIQKDKNNKLIEIDYRWNKIYGIQNTVTQNSTPFLALHQRTFILSSNEALLKQSIDSHLEPNQSVLSRPTFKRLLQKMQDDNLWVFVDIKGMVNAVQQLMKMSESDSEKLLGYKDTPELSTKEFFNAFKIYDSFGMSLILNQTGMKVKAYYPFNDNGLTPEENMFVKQLSENKLSLSPLEKATPANSMAFLAMQGLQNYPQSMKLFMEPDSISSKIYKDFRLWFKNFTGLDGVDDIIGQSDGRTGFSIFYNPEEQNLIPGAVIYLGVKDNQAFSNLLKSKLQVNLNAFETKDSQGKTKSKMEKINFPKTPTIRYKNQDIYMSELTPDLKDLKAELGIHPGYSNINSIWLFGSNQNALKAAIDSQINNISDSLEYQQVLPSNDKLKDMLLFIDIKSIINKFSAFLDSDDEFDELKPALNSLKSISASSEAHSWGLSSEFHIHIDMDKIDLDSLMKDMFKDLNNEKKLKLDAHSIH